MIGWKSCEGREARDELVEGCSIDTKYKSSERSFTGWDLGYKRGGFMLPEVAFRLWNSVSTVRFPQFQEMMITKSNHTTDIERQ